MALGYITGILPIKKIKDESALNNFREFTMISSKNLTPYYGFTEEEVISLCEQYDMPFESVKEWYDGYLIDGKHMYNPNSVVQSMMDGRCESYWKNTSAFGTINDYIELDYDGLKDDVLSMLNGGKVEMIRLGEKLHVMDHPRFNLVLHRRTRIADLSLNGKFFKRYDLQGETRAKDGAYEIPERRRGFWDVFGPAFRKADRQELDMLLPLGASLLVSEL